MDLSDSEGRGGLMAELILGPCLEETGGVSPAAPPSQDTKLEGEQPGKAATVLAGCEEAERGQAGLGVTAVSCLTCPRGSGTEEGTVAAECTPEEGRDHNWRAEEEGGESSPGPPSSSRVPAPPELGGLLPGAKEEDGGRDSPGPMAGERKSSSTETGQELPFGEGTAAGPPVGFWEDQAQDEGLQGELEEAKEKAAKVQSCCIQAEDPLEEPECPICTEIYDQDMHRPAPLNCGHVLCGQCLQAIMEAGSAADIGRVCCPICRQKTPMMEWEICRLQEELLLLGAASDPAAGTPTPLFFRPLPARRPGFWGGLEHHFQVRFHTTRMIGFLPCLRYPPRLIQGLARLEGRCRWGYRLALLALLAAESLSLLLVFLPIGLLLLLFLIMDQ